MYQIDDRTSAIKELQRLLRLNQTGIYDEKTKGSVNKIQNEYELNETGIADYTTFLAIVNKYKQNELQLWNSDYLFNPEFPYTEYDIGENVRLINDAINIVLKEYVYEGIAPKGNFLGIDTINASNFLRKIFGWKPSNEINADFVNRILIEKSAIEIKKQYS